MKMPAILEGVLYLCSIHIVQLSLVFIEFALGSWETLCICTPCLCGSLPRVYSLAGGFRVVFYLIFGSSLLARFVQIRCYLYLAVLQLYRSTSPAWSTQMGVAATHHAVLKRMIMSAFVSIVPTALITRVLLVFPSSACSLIFCCFSPPQIVPLGQFKGAAPLAYRFTSYIGQKLDFWMAHRVAIYPRFLFLFLLGSHCFRSSLSLG